MLLTDSAAATLELDVALAISLVAIKDDKSEERPPQSPAPELLLSPLPDAEFASGVVVLDPPPVFPPVFAEESCVCSSVTLVKVSEMLVSNSLFVLATSL